MKNTWALLAVTALILAGCGKDKPTGSGVASGDPSAPSVSSAAPPAKTYTVKLKLFPDIGKTVRVVVFCQGDNVAKAKEAGADFAGSDDLIWLWDVSDPASPQLLSKLSGFTAAVTSMVFSGSSQTLFAGSADHTVRIWNPAYKREVAPTVQLNGSVLSLAFSPDDTRIAVCHGNQVSVLEIGNE